MRLNAGIITSIGGDIIPYVVFLVVPILGRMSDQNPNIRQVITLCFATLIKLMPLEVETLKFFVF